MGKKYKLCLTSQITLCLQINIVLNTCLWKPSNAYFFAKSTSLSIFIFIYEVTHFSSTNIYITLCEYWWMLMTSFKCSLITINPDSFKIQMWAHFFVGYNGWQIFIYLYYDFADLLIHLDLLWTHVITRTHQT